MIQQILEIGGIKIRHTDRPQFASFIRFFQRPPCFQIAFKVTVRLIVFCPWLRCVNDHHVDIIQIQFLQRLVNCFNCCIVFLDLCGQLGVDENVLPRNTGCPHAFAHADFIAISFGCIDMSITSVDCLMNGHCRSGIVCNHPSAKTNFRDLHPIG